MSQTYQILIIAVIVPTIVLNVGRISPARRGFFCDDTSIRYPYIEEDTVSIRLVAVVGLLSSVLVVRPKHILNTNYVATVSMCQCVCYVSNVSMWRLLTARNVECYDRI